MERIDWTSGTTYDYYQDDVDMFETNTDGLLVRKFYVKNRYDQVFKCLWNNNNSSSTIEPYFEPGTYGTTNIFEGGDGYKWKFMCTIDTGSKVRFMDKDWMPINNGYNTPNPIKSGLTNTPVLAGTGDIEVINVMDGGSGYDPATSLITVTVTGDGTSANAYVEPSDVVGGVIKNIRVSSTGKNYNYSNVSITSSTGSGAIAIAPVSPIGGHGFDTVSELGCTKAIIAIEFNGSEGGIIPTDITYHQAGLVVTPTSLSTTPNAANSSIYKVSTDLIVAPGFGQFTNNEYVYQGSSLSSSTWKGQVLSFDVASNVLHTINTTGTMTTNAPIFGDTSKTTRTLLSYTTPDYVALSGYIIAIENRSGITRSADGIEQFKFLVSY